MWAIQNHAVLFGLATFFSIASTSPVQTGTILTQRDTTVSANEWNPILEGKEDAKCSDLAVIFARGTFDKGNLGPWVGGPFHDALKTKSAGIKIAVQGVNSKDYPADLAGYVKEGGSDSCAESLGRAVQKYASRCAKSKIAIWGWSQGALCAHKSLGKLGDAASNVIALGVFGDPIDIWKDSVKYPATPKGTKLLTYCEKTTADPLCTNPTEDFPKNPISFINKIKAMWEEVDATHMNDAQKEAVRNLVVQLPRQALGQGQAGQLGTDIAEGHLRRWMLTPQHFWYGIDGKVKTAADDLVRVYKESTST